MATSQFRNLDTDTSLGGSSSSDYVVASQKAIKTYVDNHSGGGSVAIDNSTITKNASDEIQAVATINANTATGATNPIYDWVGTLAEYNAQNIESLHPDWVCFITDDLSAEAYEAYTKGETLNLLAAKVDKGHQVIEFQEPTAANNYTWYRKYADGWVEQGCGHPGSFGTVTLPIEMANTYYNITITPSDTYYVPRITARTTTSFSSDGRNIDNSGLTSTTGFVSWQVSGMAA